MRLPVLLLALSATMTAAAADMSSAPGPAPSAEDRIKTALAEQFTGSSIEKVRPSPFPGWYEVVTPTELVYTDAQAKYLFVGKVIDTHTKVDLTSVRLSEVHAIDFGTLPLDKAIKIVKGNGTRIIANFEDPNCPYCRKLEEGALKDVTDVTIYTFLYPIEELHPGATARAHQIWCTPDRASSWTHWMQEGTEPPKADCKEDTIAQLQALGRSLNIDATPTTFFADGHRVEGVIEKSAMERQLDASLSVAQR